MVPMHFVVVALFLGGVFWFLLFADYLAGGHKKKSFHVFGGVIFLVLATWLSSSCNQVQSKQVSRTTHELSTVVDSGTMIQAIVVGGTVIDITKKMGKIISDDRLVVITKYESKSFGIDWGNTEEYTTVLRYDEMDNNKKSGEVR